MKLSLTLSLYIAKQFLISVAIVFLAFTCLTVLIDIIELLRKSHNKDVPFYIIIQMALLKFPLIGQKIVPFAFLIGSVLAYTKLTRTNELVVARSAGVSVWQFLAPSLLSSFLIGILIVTMLNPLACAMISKYERIEGKYLHGRSSFLDISDSGLWLRQKNSYVEGRAASEKTNDETVIHAKSLGKGDGIKLHDVIIFVFTENDKFSKRIDADNAKLLTDFWHLRNVIITALDGSTIRHDEYFLKTNLTVKDIHNSFSPPETISFWELPKFINKITESGFSALPHKLHFHTILVSPLFYTAMILIGALFSLHPARSGKSGLLITGSIIAGFLIYFLTNLISSFGLSGSMPIILAAWVPVITSMLIGTGLLLHFEDG